jgi:phage/plasmid-like protein (TIGR03299 family)
MTATATTPDVNAAFAATRADQIQAASDAQAAFDTRLADGKLIPIGDGQFRVNDPGNWDDGEVLRQQGGQILPQHELDETSGQAALYSAVPAWHGLGTVIPGGISDIDKVMELAHLDFTVTLAPVTYTVDETALTLPDTYVTVRTDTQAGLGVVGRTYTILQNREAFAFLAALVDEDVPWESAGALRDGRRTFVSLRLPRSIRIDAEGINDEIVPFLAAMNSFDGTSGFQVVATPWRPLCGNTERFAVRDAYTSWTVRHTEGIKNQVQEARRTLAMSNAYYDGLEAELEMLARTEITLDQARQVVAGLFPAVADDATPRQRTYRAGQVDALLAVYGDNAQQLGGTAYALERGVTQWLDWGRNIKPGRTFKGDGLAARATMALEGATDDIKSKAHRALLRLAA